MSSRVVNGNHHAEAVLLPPSSNVSQLSLAPSQDVTNAGDERTLALKTLLDKGHITVAPLRDPQLILHSHLPHLLGSAYGLGASPEQMTECYEHIVKSLKDIDETFARGDKINAQNWREFLRQKSHTVAYVDFFDELTQKNGGDWEAVIQRYLYSGPEPLVNGLMGGLGHPFIHLAYAYEFRSPSVASEALSLSCTEYSLCHDLLDHPIPDNSTYKTISLAEVIKRLQTDARFDGIIEFPGSSNPGLVLKPRYDALTEHWNAWVIDDPVAQFEGCCDLSVLLAISAGYPEGKFDFFYAHILTVAHAVRILWHHFPEDRKVAILRQYALFTILIYILQFRRPFAFRDIGSVEIDGRDWDWVRKTALKHKWALDEHFFKVVRALQELAATFGEKDGFYLKAAIKYLEEFNGWEGFGKGVMGFVPSRDGYIPA